MKNNLILILLILIVILLIQEHYLYYKNYYILNTIVPFTKQILEKKHCHDLTEKFYLQIEGKTEEFRTINISINRYVNNQYIGIVRYCNYFLDFNENIIEKLSKNKIININKLYLFDNDFNVIKNKILVDENNINYTCEDMRLYNDKILDKIMFSGNKYDFDKNTFLVSIGFIDENLNVSNIVKPSKNFEIKKNINENIPSYIKQIEYLFKKVINDYLNNFTKNFHLWEKNWTLLNYKNSVHVIYKWFPLHLCKINKDKLDLIEIKEMPTDFAFCRGSTNGFEYDGLIWFVIHKTTTYKQYFHLIAIFDLNMNLKGYINNFKFENCLVEFCLGIIVEKDRVIISYSTNDSNCKICIYDKNYLENLIIKV